MFVYVITGIKPEQAISTDVLFSLYMVNDNVNIKNRREKYYFQIFRIHAAKTLSLVFDELGPLPCYQNICEPVNASKI